MARCPDMLAPRPSRTPASKPAAATSRNHRPESTQAVTIAAFEDARMTRLRQAMGKTLDGAIGGVSIDDFLDLLPGPGDLALQHVVFLYNIRSPCLAHGDVTGGACVRRSAPTATAGGITAGGIPLYT
jgi:hypothetical protein